MLINEKINYFNFVNIELAWIFDSKMSENKITFNLTILVQHPKYLKQQLTCFIQIFNDDKIFYSMDKFPL